MVVTKQVFGSREEWLQARRNHIGGSDAAACVGMSPYKDNVQLWEEKMGLVEPEDISDKERRRRNISALCLPWIIRSIRCPTMRITCFRMTGTLGCTLPWMAS